MRILKERAAISSYVGNNDLDAEIVVLDEDKELFIHVHYGDDCSAYTVAEESIFDYCTGDKKFDDDTYEPVENLEDYETLEETETSKYAKYFQIAERMIDDIADSYKEEHRK